MQNVGRKYWSEEESVVKTESFQDDKTPRTS